MRKKLLIGFDLDGVVLYNAVRIFRLPIAIGKRFFLKKKALKFYYPKSPLEKKLWSLLHLSSLFVAPGFETIKTLVREEKIAAYIISSRYSFLKDDFEKWLEKIEAKKYFSGSFYNKNDEQPHFFKERMIKKLKLDIFIEDNWDIVEHLSKETETKIFWVYNLLDKNIKYKYTFPSLLKTILYIKENLINN